MIGYYVPVLPQLASYRLRVDLPSKHLGMPHRLGIGDVTFFFKAGNPEVAKKLPLVVYDVVNAHFHVPEYRRMCDLAAVVTCSSQAMVGIIKEATGRDAVVIPDPYENSQSAPEVKDGVLWFGHQANIGSAKPYADLITQVCTGEGWTRAKEDADLASAGVVLLTASNPGASSNRPVKAIRAGRFVVAPQDCPQSWRELSEFMWIGDVREGVRWAFANREEACRKVSAGQKYAEIFSPQLIGSQWAGLFASTLGRDINTKQAGSVSISR